MPPPVRLAGVTYGKTSSGRCGVAISHMVQCGPFGCATRFKVVTCSSAPLKAKGAVVTGAFHYGGASVWVPYAVVVTNTGGAVLSRHLLEQFASRWITQAAEYDSGCGGQKVHSPLTVLPPSRGL